MLTVVGVTEKGLLKVLIVPCTLVTVEPEVVRPTMTGRTKLVPPVVHDVDTPVVNCSRQSLLTYTVADDARGWKRLVRVLDGDEIRIGGSCRVGVGHREANAYRRSWNERGLTISSCEEREGG